MTEFDITFMSHGRKATQPPNPLYPNGMDIETGHPGRTCLATLPYPAECCGVLLVRCKTCGAVTAITTAGRVDDPRTVKVPCSRAWP